MEFQYLVILVVVVLSILDAITKKARQRGAGTPVPGDQTEGADGTPATIAPTTVSPPTAESSAPARSVPRAQQGPGTPQSADKAGDEWSVLDIFVPSEMRRGLGDVLAGESQAGGASGTAGRAGAPDAGGVREVPEPALGETGFSSPADSLPPRRDRAPRPVVPVRSRAPRPIEAHARTSRSAAAAGDAAESRRSRVRKQGGPDQRDPRRRRPSVPDADDLGLGTIAGLRRVVVAREVLGPPLALRDEGGEGSGR